MYGRKRSDFQVHIIEIDGKRHVVSRIPSVSDIWADATPEAKLTATIIIIIIIIGGLIMDAFNLQFGGIASEAQLMNRNLAVKAEITGPARNYWYDGWLFSRDEVAKRDPRIKPIDVKMENSPERYKKFYGNFAYKANEYIGNGRFQFFYSYIILGSDHTEFVYGTIVLWLDQKKQLGIFVQQQWVVDDYKITYSEVKKR